MTTNGQLLAMSPDQRTATIERLGADVRRTLANIACLGSGHEVRESFRLRSDGSDSWADQKLQHAARLSDLAAELTEDGA